MKKQTLKTSVLKHLLVLTILLMAFIIHSCKKNYSKTTAKLDDATAQAKSWYENAYPITQTGDGKLVTASTGHSFDLSQRIKPDWQHSRKYRRDNKDVIELPIDPGTKYSGTMRDWATDRIPYDKNNSRSYFLLFNDGKKYTAYVMTVIADQSYLKGDTSKLKNNTFSHNDPDFTGLVLYFTPKGKYVRGYAYNNGQPVIPGTTANGNQKVQSVGNPVLKPQNEVVVCIDWYWQTWVDGVLVDEEYLYTTCSGDNGDTGGGSGGTTPPPPCGGSAPIPAAVNNSHVSVNSVGNSPKLNFLPPPTDPGDPCDPAASHPDSPNFGEPGTGINRIIDDSNFDNLLSWLDQNGYDFSDPADVQLTVNGVTYTGQVTTVYDSNGNAIARYFSPDVTTAQFHMGMEYSVGVDVPSDPMSISVFGGTLGQYTNVTITSTGGGSNAGGAPGSAALWSNPNSPVNAPDDPLINYGIGVTNVDASSQLTGARVIARSVDRRPTPPTLPEDMTYGTNGNVTGIKSSEINETDAQLFDGMANLQHTFTILDVPGGLNLVADKMRARFQANTGGQFSDPILNSKVASSSEYLNFLQKVGNQLNTQLRLKNGDMSKVSTITLSYHPIFNGLYNKYHGLQILIDDTEYTEISIANFGMINGKWSATLDITIHDDFGVDKNDALTYQGYHYGFADWWLLQHKRGYKPFETIVHLRTIISSTYQILEE